MVPQRAPVNFRVWITLCVSLLLIHRSCGQPSQLGDPTPLLKNGQTENERCPNAEEIAPCQCYFKDWRVSLDCSQVTSESQLQQIFDNTTKFPVKQCRRFTMENVNLTKLDTQFNDISFEEFFLNDLNNVTEITERFFQSSVKTFYRLRIFRAPQLSSFPFSALPSYTNLRYIIIMTTNITSLPPIVSESLVTLQIINSGISELLPGTFDSTPNLYLISFDGLPLKRLRSRMFPIGDNGKIVEIIDSHLEVIEPSAFHLTTFTPGRFRVDLSDSRISLLREEVWDPLLSIVNTINLNGNPISCGCEVSWLLHREDLSMKITGDYFTQRCANSTLARENCPA